MHITPDILVASYELVRLTPPFRGWRLPDPDTLEFRVGAIKGRYGHFRACSNGLHEISVSSAACASLDVLTAVMMHEMVHLEAHRRGYTGAHGGIWRKLANQVCRTHHLDPKAF